MKYSKAMEHATERAQQANDGTLAVEVAAAVGYEFGFAAGLMEGARMAMNDGGWTRTIGDIQKRSRVLVKAMKNK